MIDHSPRHEQQGQIGAGSQRVDDRADHLPDSHRRFGMDREAGGETGHVY
jgi:hypothetical protein